MCNKQTRSDGELGTKWHHLTNLCCKKNVGVKSFLYLFVLVLLRLYFNALELYLLVLEHTCIFTFILEYILYLLVLEYTCIVFVLYLFCTCIVLVFTCIVLCTVLGSTCTKWQQQHQAELQETSNTCLPHYLLRPFIKYTDTNTVTQIQYYKYRNENTEIQI